MIPTHPKILSFVLERGVVSIRADAITSTRFVPGDDAWASRTIIRTADGGGSYVAPCTLAEHENAVARWMQGIMAIAEVSSKSTNSVAPC